MIELIVPAGFPKAVKELPDWMQIGLARLLHDLLIRTAISEERQSGHFINVPSSHWGALLGKDRYTRVVSKAEEIGLLEVNPRYSAGRFSKSYRLSGMCRGASLELFVDPTARKGFERFWNLGDATGKWLASQLKRFDIEAKPDMAKPWEAVSIFVIRTGWHYATRCEFGNRFHSIYTATSRDLRPYLRAREYKDDLGMIDVANSQPLFLGLEAHRHGYDCERWLGLGAEGRIYNYLAQKMNVTRDEAKAQLLPVIFEKLERMERYEIFKTLNRYFPGIVGYMIDAKKAEHRDLAKNCQLLESRIFVDGVVGSLIRGGFDLPLLTIHDAAITTLEGSSEVEKEIKAKFRELGTDVKLHRGNLRRDRRGVHRRGGGGGQAGRLQAGQRAPTSICTP